MFRVYITNRKTGYMAMLNTEGFTYKELRAIFEDFRATQNITHQELSFDVEQYPENRLSPMIVRGHSLWLGVLLEILIEQSMDKKVIEDAQKLLNTNSIELDFLEREVRNIFDDGKEVNERRWLEAKNLIKRFKEQRALSLEC